MDLRSGQTIWNLKHGPPDDYRPLTRDTRCDVAIIGGGVTGAFVAYELIKGGVDCLLIDKAVPGGGSTGASTALLVYELDTSLCELARHLGSEADAGECYRICRDAIYKLETTVAELGSSCDFARRKSLYLSEWEDEERGLIEEFAARRKCGLNLDFLDRKEIERAYSFSRPAALLTHDAAEIDVQKFLSALICSGILRGVRVFGHTQIEDCDFSRDGVRLRTGTGIVIHARKVVFATGYESQRFVGRSVGALKSTYVVATEPIADFRGWPDRSLIWTTARPYLYLRATADGRAIIGGEDVDFQDDILRDALIPQKSEKLLQALRAMFPDVGFRAACAWTGTFGESEDGLPYIGSNRVQPNAYFALGYGGNGICYSAIAAEIIRDDFLGRHHPAARLFRFDR